jgi:ABC-type transporter Mla MlaB component
MTTSVPRTITFTIWGPIARDDLPGLCARVCALFGEQQPDVALCKCATVGADAVTVDALAKLQLAARGYGCVVRLRGVADDLRRLVAFMGLTDVLVED